MSRSAAVALARLSCLMPVIAALTYLIFAKGFGSSEPALAPGMAMEGELCASGLFLGIGLMFAFMALKAIRRRGPKRIRVPAAIGMITNGVLVIILIVLWVGKQADAG